MKTYKNLFLRQPAACLLAMCLSLGAAFAGPSVEGVPHFQLVNDQVYRGGQPSAEGFRNLAAMGIKTIVDLRKSGDRSKAEQKVVKANGMRYVSIPMKGMTTPTEKQIEHALRILHDSSAAPVFVHCRRGKDRTGVVLACYRIGHDNWGNQKALNEARSLGMGWYEFPLQRYVLNYHPDRSHGFVSAASRVGDKVRNLSEESVDAVKRGVGEVLDRIKN